jgi:fucose permease
VTSAAINQVGRFYHATPASLGWLFRLLMISFFVGVAVAGRYGDRYGKLWAIWPGCIAMTLGLIAFIATPRYDIAMLSTLLMGLGGGASEGSAMALMADLYSGSQRTRMANWSQAAFSFGAIACPLGIGLLLRYDIDWRVGYLGAAVFCAITAILTLAAMVSGKERIIHPTSEHAGLKMLLSDRLVLVLAISIMLYVGAETGTSNWLAVYFRHDLGSAAALAAWSLSFFWLGISLGRVMAGWASRCVREVSLIRGCLVAAAVFQALLLLVHTPMSGVAAVFLLGLFLGPIYPTIASCSGGAYPRQSGAVLGIVVAAGSMGGAIFPPTIGLIADHTGMRLALWVSFVVILLNLCALLLLRRRDIARICGH